MSKQLSDAELFEAGRRGVAKGGCPSVIVGTDAQGIRNYHQCSGGSSHVGKPVMHYCGCGEEWEEWHRHASHGPLTDVVFVP